MATLGAQRGMEADDAAKSFDDTRYADFFSRLTGKRPYSYQTALAQELFRGNSLILRAPTGSGKTWATVAPFVYSCLTQNRLADRLIYALPLRSLASNLHDSTNGRLTEVDKLRGRICRSAKNRRYRPDDPFYLGLQMGGQQDDPFFEGDITFTTIDQLLSAYLFAPVSLPSRVGNIGAGALIGSLLVFDEVHLLDPKRSLATTVEMLVRLKGLAQFVLMTATMPDSVMNWLGIKLSATSMPLTAEEVRQLPSHANKRREFEWCSSPLNAEDILREHKNRTIVIVNTVGRAQELYRDVCEKLEKRSNPATVFLLHSRFFPEDRRTWELQITDYFGPDAISANAILISTQVIEAGIDISADVLLTELAPLNSLLQRAGRVARYVSRNTGRLLVFDLATDEQGQTKLGPYRDVAEIVGETRKLLEFKNKLPLLDYVEELAWLKHIHEVPDHDALKPLNSLGTRIDEILRAMDGLDDAACSRLVRETSSVNVVLTDNPEELQFNSKEWPEFLSVPRTSLFQLKDACERTGPYEWVLKVPGEIESESNQALNFQWKTIKNPAGVAWLVAINPKHARYSERIGLEFRKPSDSDHEVRRKSLPPIPRYTYQRESFVVHAKRVVEQGARILMQLPHAFNRLAKRHQEVNLANIFMLACALHDTGKLQTNWQDKAQEWQLQIDSKLRRSYKHEPLAHTDFDPQRDRGEPWPKFPPHAACGGFAVLSYLVEHFPYEIALLLCTVITRHHGAHTKELNQFELARGADAILEYCLPDFAPRPVSVRLELQSSGAIDFAENCLLHMTDHERMWPLYASVVRLLRLADQGSFQD